MATISHIHQDAAQRIHADLVTALGSENVPNQWMHFMATVRRHLPEVLSKGRPSRQAIEASVIGALGFSTWRELLEAPVDQGGLALSWSTWRQWSRAWAVIVERPALQGEPLTAAEVNRMASQAKAEGLMFPSDSEALGAFQETLSQRREEARAETHQGMRERIEALEGLLVEARANHEALRHAVQEAEQRRKDAEQEARDLRDQLRAVGERSFWQRLRAVFTS